MSSNVEPVTVYKPFKAGFPDMRKYLIDMWDRRAFVFELSKTDRESENLDTLFGKLWGLINPLFSAAIYFLFIFIVQGSNQGQERFLHLLCGIFLFEFLTRSATRGANSMVAASALINNTRFPRALIPLTNVLTAWQLFLPTIPIYFIFHFFMGGQVSWNLVQAVPAMFLVILIASGIAMFSATAQIYLRDTGVIIPYVLRLMMFASPILYFPEQAKEALGGNIVAVINPIFSVFEIFSGAITRESTFPIHTWVTASVWAIFIFVAGFVFLVRREGEFAARL